MKGLGIVGLILAVVSLGLALYCQLEIVPNYEFFDSKVDLQQFERDLWHSYADQKFLYGSIALFLGPISALIGLIVGLKKNKLGWVVLCLGLIAFVFGALQSTHMFS
jgi:thiosulfate reductase cytochrome b subunit